MNVILKNLLLMILLSASSLLAQAKKDSLHEYFLMNKAPASEYWLGFFQRFPNVQGVILDKVVVPFGDTIDIPIEKVWKKQKNEKTILLSGNEREGLSFQQVFVVKDTNIVDCDVLKYVRDFRKTKVITKFELEKLGARNYRKWEILPSGQRVNRGLFTGKPDDVLIGAFKPKENKAKEKIKKEKSKVKAKEK